MSRAYRACPFAPLQAKSKTADRRLAIRTITDDIFNWTETTRRALERHWEVRTDAERVELIPLFRDLLERAFLVNIEQYGAEKIVYVGESLDGGETRVRIQVTLMETGTPPFIPSAAGDGSCTYCRASP